MLISAASMVTTRWFATAGMLGQRPQYAGQSHDDILIVWADRIVDIHQHSQKRSGEIFGKRCARLADDQKLDPHRSRRRRNRPRRDIRNRRFSAEPAVGQYITIPVQRELQSLQSFDSSNRKIYGDLVCD